MTEPRKPSNQEGDESVVERLLRMAGPRPEAPEDATRRVRDAAHAAWRQTVAARRKRRMMWLAGGLAAAAAAALVVGLQVRSSLLVPAGELMLSSGSLMRSDGSIVRPGGQLMPGEALTTGSGARAALRLAGGPTLRMDEETRVVMEGPYRLELQHGTIYLESSPSDREHGRLEIETQAGIVRDIGTRFEVRSRDGETRVRVRHGSVSLDNERGSEPVPAGAELTTDAAGRTRTGTVSAADPSWSWIHEIAPPFEIEGRTLGAFLDWFTAETGLAVSFEPAAAESRSREIVLHGSVAGIRPHLTAGVVLPTCGLDSRLDGDTLVVTPADRNHQ